MTPKKLLRKPRMLAKLEIANATAYDWLNPKSPRYDPTFPRPIKIGTAAVAWIESEIDDWIAAKIQSRDEK